MVMRSSIANSVRDGPPRARVELVRRSQRGRNLLYPPGPPRGIAQHGQLGQLPLSRILFPIPKVHEARETHDPPILHPIACDMRASFVSFAGRAGSAKSKRIAESSHHYKSCAQVNKDSSSRLASTQRKEVIRCLMVQQAGRRRVFLTPKTDRTAVTFGR